MRSIQFVIGTLACLLGAIHSSALCEQPWLPASLQVNDAQTPNHAEYGKSSTGSPENLSDSEDLFQKSSATKSEKSDRAPSTNKTDKQISRRNSPRTQSEGKVSAGKGLVTSLSLSRPSGSEKKKFRPTNHVSLVSIGGSLCVVVGFFVVTALMIRRSMPKGLRTMPLEVVEVLGRSSLIGRQQMYVVRFGNKLLLLWGSPNAVETLSEVSDEAEVTRLLGIFEQSNTNSSSKAFRDVLRQFSSERTSPGFLGNAVKDTLTLAGGQKNKQKSSQAHVTV